MAAGTDGAEWLADFSDSQRAEAVWSCPAFGGYLNVEIQEKMFIKSDEIVDMHSLFA
ncbi:MAG TPA: hypothetical protein VGF67_33760 [Ktedonobacteraceae bacterium]|jgi:hypothetical protein